MTERLPAILGGDATAGREIIGHVESCLACRSELARYNKMMRLLAQLRDERPAVPNGLLDEVLASVGAAAERQMIRSALSRRRLAYAGGLGLSVAVASGVVFVARARHSMKRSAPARSAEGVSAP